LPSRSLAETVVTAVWFSATLTAALSTPPSDVMVTPSLTFVTKIWIDWKLEDVPSDADTMTV
jgi:hypothetical protein